ncbi:hypothetical protein GCM10009642_42490 [Nocardiopsis metallicus]|uniref:Putative MFS family arabinose efflux permease n=1 Tax=Nocardiopsis metallicus TaxID=179819 RepID=A0A840WMT8_9ACTN|nr:hypothetical protein [Nocardiopsis metallicus]MBB5493076.1 putative MFS family arabinose efflux permease [Nocardiopsis metallicus]
MSADLRVSESAAGQTVTVYAIGAALTAIPLAAATAGWRRKRLLLAAMGTFAEANTVTALSSAPSLTMTARFVAGVAAALLGAFSGTPGPVYAAAALWGLGWGGAPTPLQTAVADAGGEAAETARAVLVTPWNVAMAGGGAVGELLLAGLGFLALPWSVALLLVPVLVAVLVARAHGFPSTSQRAEPAC